MEVKENFLSTYNKYLIAIILLLQFFQSLNHDMLKTSRTKIVSIFQVLSISADLINVNKGKQKF